MKWFVMLVGLISLRYLVILRLIILVGCDADVWLVIFASWFAICCLFFVDWLVRLFCLIIILLGSLLFVGGLFLIWVFECGSGYVCCV